MISKIRVEVQERHYISESMGISAKHFIGGFFVQAFFLHQSIGFVSLGYLSICMHFILLEYSTLFVGRLQSKMRGVQARNQKSFTTEKC